MRKQRRKNCVTVKRGGWEKDNVAHHKECAKSEEGAWGGRPDTSVPSETELLISGKDEKKHPMHDGHAMGALMNTK